jgi:hypothetical protein
MKALRLFESIPETKTEIRKISTLLRGAVASGEVNPLVTAKKLAVIEKIIEEVKGDMLVRDAILAEAEKYGKSFDFQNAKFQIRESGVRFDYSNCQDAEHEEISEQINALTTRLKAREGLLKAVTGDSELYGKDGRRLEPPLKKSTTGVTITIND